MRMLRALFLTLFVPLAAVAAEMPVFDAHSESTAMIGDRMDTDIVAGLEAGLHTILVMTGVTTRAEIDRFPYRPSRVVDGVADLVSTLAVAE